MSNILPSYLVSMFLNRGSKEQLYHEYIDNVAVLFASIVNFPLDTTSLRVLNEYICYFDDLTENYTENYKVEKIKVINWTYVAACGLGKGDHQSCRSTDSGSKLIEDHSTITPNISSE